MTRTYIRVLRSWTLIPGPRSLHTQLCHFCLQSISVTIFISYMNDTKRKRNEMVLFIIYMKVRCRYKIVIKMQNKVYLLNIQIIVFAFHKIVFSTNIFFNFFLILHQITEIRSFPLLTPPKIRKI